LKTLLPTVVTFIVRNQKQCRTKAHSQSDTSMN